MIAAVILNSDSLTVVVLLLLAVGLFLVKSQNVVCKSCGWKGSKSKWKSSGDSCPNCHSDLFKEG
jgi:predicted Zn-ribbon and HTH transcriptional regulator